MTTQTPITLWRKTLGEDRRERYTPTNIAGASYAEDIGTKQSSGGVWTQERIYKIRIPLQNIPEGTVEAGDLITLGTTAQTAALTESEVRATGRTITVTDWADNTRRGSGAVKHWRITGR